MGAAEGISDGTSVDGGLLGSFDSASEGVELGNIDVRLLGFSEENIEGMLLGSSGSSNEGVELGNINGRLLGFSEGNVEGLLLG